MCLPTDTVRESAASQSHTKVTPASTLPEPWITVSKLHANCEVRVLQRGIKRGKRTTSSLPGSTT